jgi:lipoprotein LprG
MQTRPRLAVLLSLFTALMTALVLTSGCSSSEKKNDGPLPDAAGLVKQSSDATKNQHSVHLVLTVTGKIKKLPISLVTGDLTNDPAVAASGKANIEALGSKLEDVSFVVIDGNLYADALSPGTFTDFGPAADLFDFSAILSPDKGLANILANFSEPKAEGRESIGGVEGVKITGKVTPEAVNAIAPQIEATGPVPATAWIREDGDHELLQASLEPTPGNVVQMTMTDWGKPVTVTKPEGV